MDIKFLLVIGIIAGLVCGVWTGCGYQLAGSGRLPHGIKRIFVAEPVNRTSEMRLISIVSNELKSELTRRQVKMADNFKEADGILVSEIVSLTDTTIARRGETTALEKRLEMGMDVKLQNQDGDVLWSGENIRSDGTYAVISGDDIVTENNRQAAIVELSRRLAEDLHHRLTADF